MLRLPSASAAIVDTAATADTIEHPDLVAFVPLTSPLGENHFAFLFIVSNNAYDINSTCTPSSSAAVGVAKTGSDSAVGGFKHGYDDRLTQRVSKAGSGRRQAKRMRLMMGSLSQLLDDEVKRMRWVKNRESGEKFRTKQRLRIEVLVANRADMSEVGETGVTWCGDADLGSADCFQQEQRQERQPLPN